MREFNSYRFGAGRYIQEEMLLEDAGQEFRRFGKKAYLLSGINSWEAVKERMLPSLEKAEVEWFLNQYQGFPSINSAVKFRAEAEREGCDFIVGVGGGIIMDLAKMIALPVHIPLMLIPTSTATCAAFSPLSVVYTDEGQCVRAWNFDKEVDEVLVDEKVLSMQPQRLMAAGIMDAMAKFIEISNGKTEITLETDSIDKFSAYSMAKFSYKVLEEYGQQAYQDVGKKQLTTTVHNVIYTTIAVTGVISAMMRGHRQTALAHKLYDTLRTKYFKESAAHLHGEIVATGLIMQLSYNHNEKGIPTLKSYMEQMKMPMNLQELGLDCDEETISDLTEIIEKSGFVEDSDEARENLKNAIKEIVV